MNWSRNHVSLVSSLVSVAEKFHEYKQVYILLWRAKSTGIQTYITEAVALYRDTQGGGGGGNRKAENKSQSTYSDQHDRDHYSS